MSACRIFSHLHYFEEVKGRLEAFCVGGAGLEAFGEDLVTGIIQCSLHSDWCRS